MEKDIDLSIKEYKQNHHNESVGRQSMLLKFREEYGKDALSKLTPKDKLYKIFGGKANKSLLYQLEQGDFKTDFGSCRGPREWANILTNDKKENKNKWCYCENQNKKKVLTDDEAEKKAGELVDSLISAIERIDEYKKGGRLESADGYEDLDEELKDVLGLMYNKIRFKKYFAMLYPDLFMYTYSKEWIKKHFDKLGLEFIKNKSWYVQSGRYALFAKKHDISNLDLYHLVDDIINGRTDDENKTENGDKTKKNERQNYNCDKFPKNMILYGPPGTGKTYNTVYYAVAIIENSSPDKLKDELKNNTYNYEEVLKKFNSYKDKNQIRFVTFHQSYCYEEFIEGIKPEIGNGNIIYKVKPGIFKEFCREAEENKNADKKYVFIIDEINRGNISKIFGELITLIEDTKRKGEKEGISITLPYSQESFGVPNNVYIVGTMNTADRSIAHIDTALRRRFNFIEMLPDAEKLEGVCVEGIDIKSMLVAMNERISVLYDREHTIGHAYFLELKSDSTIDALAKIFENKIIPLLQEYFFDDYEKIGLVLGDNLKGDDKYKFIKKQTKKASELFGKSTNDIEDSAIYEICKENFNKPEAYKNIYPHTDGQVDADNNEHDGE